MKTEELKEYLGIVVDMEESIFLQRNIVFNIKKEMESLKIPANFLDPDEPVMPNDFSIPSDSADIGYIIFKCIAGSVGWFFAGGFIGLIIGAIPHIAEFVLLAIVAPIIWIIYCVHYGCKCMKKNAEAQRKYQQNLKEYQRELKKYQSALDENKCKRQQDETDRQIKTFFLHTQEREVEKHLATSENHLRLIYEKNIIFPKYRNLVMVSSLYEYICAGRCVTLEGHEGAYNILETEIRLDRIITGLDQVIAYLEQIQRNQFMLYSAVQSANKRLSQILTANGRIADNLAGLYSNSVELNDQIAELNTRIVKLQESSELAAYQAERTQKELAYMNRMDYLSGRNDDVFFNHPPM